VYLRTHRGLNIGVAATFLVFVAYTVWRLGQGGIVGYFFLAVCLLLPLVVLGAVAIQWMYMRHAAVWLEDGTVFRRDLVGRLHRTRVSDIARVIEDPDTRGPETVPYVSLISASGQRLISFDRRMWSEEDLDRFWVGLGKSPES
jgi:hypothetical protein